MVKIELVYDSSCPNIEKARERISGVLSELKLPQEWSEWDRANPEAPNYIKRYGSPTILVNERDVANITDKTAGDSCRLYRDEKGRVEGLPSALNIKQAILQSKKDSVFSGWFVGLTALPAVVASSIPILSCPLCWPLYTAILGSMGLGFFNYTPYLLPITLLFFLVALSSIWYQAKKCQSSYRPLYLAIASSVTILIGKFLFVNIWIVVFGLIAFIASVFWNLILVFRKPKSCCSGKDVSVK
jgi:mercuric ion transport protein